MAFLQRTQIFINHYRNKRIFFFFCRMKNLPFKLTYLVQHELARVTFNLKCSAFKFLSTSCCFTHKIVDLQNIYQVFFSITVLQRLLLLVSKTEVDVISSQEATQRRVDQNVEIAMFYCFSGDKSFMNSDRYHWITLLPCILLSNFSPLNWFQD